ncbi:Flp pilus assembly pilin Flp [Sphingomonas jejuensis]|uniref:Flp pilus assembly pilin Flp n=1 Tax=Sphingomonas jejuensis TaxID=904715 RepID=A0ABX0XJE4_9SPHN|nr:TadE/TadG family type IV pilus assembly protein [Sphingomonas jejuensis]NJC33462.1 Flp pilus assembly pilin Flp [Sphingomonas jejuensis]
MTRRSLRRDRRGTTVIEFAVLAPVLILLIIGSIEMGHFVMVRSTLEGALGTAARKAMADLTATEEERDEQLRASVTRQMATFPTIDGEELEIETTVYAKFGDAYPESFEDTNENGQYDGPNGTFPGESFDDRNRNGVRDMATQKDGLLGGPGDVVAYRAVFPAALFFKPLGEILGLGEGITMSADIVMRNEPVVRSARSS